MQRKYPKQSSNRPISTVTNTVHVQPAAFQYHFNSFQTAKRMSLLFESRWIGVKGVPRGHARHSTSTHDSVAIETLLQAATVKRHGSYDVIYKIERVGT